MLSHTGHGMSTFSRRSHLAIAGLATVLLVVWSLRGALPSADDTPSDAIRVVDAFVSARAALDVAVVAGLLHADARIVDGRHDVATGTDGLPHLLPLAGRIELGPRHLSDVGEVSWTETVVPNGRPSWENNPNWFVNDLTADQPVLLSQPAQHTSTPRIISIGPPQAAARGDCAPSSWSRGSRSS